MYPKSLLTLHVMVEVSSGCKLNSVSVSFPFPHCTLTELAKTTNIHDSLSYSRPVVKEIFLLKILAYSKLRLVLC